MTDSDRKDEAQSQLRIGCELFGLAEGRVFRHYKGPLYVVVALSIHEATYEPLVTYRSNVRGTCSTRTLKNFTEVVPPAATHQKPVRRFEGVME